MNEIFEAIVNLLGTQYKVIKSFDAEEEIDLNGVLAVNINDVENLHHGTTKDSRYAITINGQTLTEQDKDRSKINEMFDYVSAVDFQQLIEMLDGCAGIVINNSTITSDGETNNFSYSFDLYICKD